MKKLILSILIVLSFNVQSQDTWEYRNDKRAHTLTGYALACVNDKCNDTEWQV